MLPRKDFLFLLQGVEAELEFLLMGRALKQLLYPLPGVVLAFGLAGFQLAFDLPYRLVDVLLFLLHLLILLGYEPLVAALLLKMGRPPAFQGLQALPVCPVGKEQLGVALLNTAAQVAELPVELNHLVRILAHLDHPVGILLEPGADILIFRLEIRDLAPVVAQVDEMLVIAHRAQDYLLYELRIHPRVQEHVLKRARDVLVGRALHEGVVVEFLRAGPVVAVDDVAELFVLVHYPAQ